MRRIAYSCFILFFLAACDNKEEIVQLIPTEMEVRVLDVNGSIVPRAEVKIYRNNRDWRTLSREVDTQITDNEGIAYFTDLLPVNYYYFVSFEQNGRTFTNQYVNLDFGNVDGSNYELADFLTDNAITRVTVSATHERPNSSQITDVIISDVNIYLTESFDSESSESDTLTLNLATLIDYDPFVDDLDEALIDDVTAYDQIELYDLTKARIGNQDFFFNSFETVLTPQEFLSSTFVFYEFDEDFFFSSQYDYFLIEESDISFSDQEIIPYSLILGDIFYGNDVYSVEVILDYQ